MSFRSNTLIVEPLQKEDLPALFDLYRQVMAFPPSDSYEQYWMWRYTLNPFDDGTRPAFWVVRSARKIIGGMAQMPVVANVEGTEVEARWAGDLMVDPAFRGQGIGKLIFDNYREANRLSISMGYAPDSVTSRIARSVGFKWFPPFTFLFKFYSVRLLAERLSWFKPAVHALSALSRPVFRLARRRFDHAPEDVVLMEMDCFGSTFDSLWRRVASEFPVSVRRTYSSMNWRYFDNPFFSYQALGAWRDAELVGCLVLKVVHGEALTYGTIPELVAAREDRVVQTALLGWALEVFERERVDVVKALGSPPYLSSLLKSAGFLPLGKGCDFVISKAPDLPSVLLDCNAWYLTKGDCDLDIVPDFLRVAV